MVTPMKVLGNALSVLALLGVATFFVLDWHYQRVLPRSPEPSTGHTIAKDIHGAVVYMSSREVLLSNGSFFGGIFLGVVGGFVLRREKGR